MELGVITVNPQGHAMGCHASMGTKGPHGSASVFHSCQADAALPLLPETGRKVQRVGRASSRVPLSKGCFLTQPKWVGLAGP